MQTVSEVYEGHKLSWKRRAVLAFFFIEVLAYPFIVANELESGGFEADLGNRVAFRGLTILFVWVPVAVTTGFALGRKLKDRPDIITFFQTRDVSADEVAPIIGIFAPLAIVTAVLLFWLAAISLQLFWISILLYFIIRKWKKKGIRDFLDWVFRLVMRIAIRLKRLSYIGYFLPILFGAWFANGITQNAEAHSSGTFVLILIQMVVLVALWQFIKVVPKPKLGQAGQGISPTMAPLSPASQIPQQIQVPSIFGSVPRPQEQPLPQSQLPQTAVTQHPLPQTPSMLNPQSPKRPPPRDPLQVSSTDIPPAGQSMQPPGQQMKPSGPQIQPPRGGQRPGPPPMRPLPQHTLPQHRPPPARGPLPQMGQGPPPPVGQSRPPLQSTQPGSPPASQQSGNQQFKSPPNTSGQGRPPQSPRTTGSTSGLPPAIQNLGSAVPPPKKKKGLFGKK